MQKTEKVHWDEWATHPGVFGSGNHSWLAGSACRTNQAAGAQVCWEEWKLAEVNVTCVSVAPKARNSSLISASLCNCVTKHTGRPTSLVAPPMLCISIQAKVNSTIKAIKNTISRVLRRLTDLAHELFVILDFLSWWPCKVNPCIAVHPLNTKYGWIKHFHSSHYYLISCLTELSVWSNPWGFTTTRTGIIMTSGLLLRKYSKPEESHRYFPSSSVWSISASTLSINKSLLMHPACIATCYGKHF